MNVPLETQAIGRRTGSPAKLERAIIGYLSGKDPDNGEYGINNACYAAEVIADDLAEDGDHIRNVEAWVVDFCNRNDLEYKYEFDADAYVFSRRS